jgi:hypothetical protein
MGMTRPIDLADVMKKVDELLTGKYNRMHGHQSMQVEALASVLIDEINTRLEILSDDVVPAHTASFVEPKNDEND